MTNSEVVRRLQQEVNKNSAASAIFHVFALRERARNSITINSLAQKMRREGFNIDRGEYIGIVKLLNSLGLGTLELTPKGRIVGLNNITIKLQSIGRVACGQATSLQTLKSKPYFKEFPTLPERELPSFYIVFNKKPIYFDFTSVYRFFQRLFNSATQ